jgi:hypothetical protein
MISSNEPASFKARIQIIYTDKVSKCFRLEEEHTIFCANPEKKEAVTNPARTAAITVHREVLHFKQSSWNNAFAIVIEEHIKMLKQKASCLVQDMRTELWILIVPFQTLKLAGK